MRISTRRKVVALLIVLAVAASISTTNAGRIYWTEEYDWLQRANLDGSSIQNIAADPLGGIAIDLSSRTIYWNSFTSGTGGPKLRRLNLDGSNPVILREWNIWPTSLAVDSESGWVFTGWDTGEGCDGIWRARLDGAGDEQRIVWGPCAYGIAVDREAGKLYWTETSGWIRRANLDGTDVEVVIDVDNGRHPRGLALDVARGKMYWTETGYQAPRPMVVWADLDGSNEEILISGDESAGAIALDLRADKIYISLPGESRNDIYQANLDASDLHRVLDVSARGQIAVDPAPHGADVPAVSVRGLAIGVLAMLVLSAVLLRRRVTGSTRG
jgi:hypothetical protein